MTAVTQPRPTLLVSPQVESASLRVQIHAAWAVMIMIPALAILGGQAGVLRVAFPALSLIIGGFLLWRSKPAYVGLVFWLWFLTPFLAHMADYQGGWTQNSAVELAPYTTAGLVGVPLLASFGSLDKKKILPYACALVAVLYGLVLGLVSLPLFNVLRALLNWVVPILFGLFIYQNRDLYFEFRRVIERSFLFGTLVTGAYGIYQFFVLPEWDRIWVINAQLNSFGAPEALKIRAFSTMNAPAIFAAVTVCGLLLLFNIKGHFRLLATGCGFMGLLLTMSRASWLSLAAGGIYLIIWARLRMASAIFACGIFLMGMTTVPVVHDLLMQRIETFYDPSQDVSFSARVAGHEQAFRLIFQEPFGEGMGSTETNHPTEGDDDIIGPHDSTILEVLYSLGWTGSLVYAFALVTLGVRLLKVKRTDTFIVSAQAILLGFAAQCLLNSVLLGVLGFMVWTFASMCLAAPDLRDAIAPEPGLAANWEP